MNFLAHLQLSGDHPDWIVGGFLGDFVKGRLKGQYPREVEAGIQLHRKIDRFTDQHPLLKQCHTLFTPELRRYSGIIVDISFDHFLARHWARYDERELTTFNTLILDILLKPPIPLPDNAQLFLQRMVSRDILLQYRLPEVIPFVLQKTSQRFSRDNPLSHSGEQFVKQYDALEILFCEFYPELEEFARNQRALLAAPK
ncbi:MAG: DUF479 domain-containing protein [Pseudomonadales bacterium]|nr:DUF479 domain-containing protein [Pseudomonadales bacterium]